MRAKLLSAVFAAAAIGLGGPAGAVEDVVKIGVLTDMTSGFSAWSGQGSVIAAQMAAEDFLAGKNPPPFKVEILSADHQNKADVGSAVVRDWLSKGVDAVADVPNSSVAQAVNFLLRGSQAAFLVSGGGSDKLTREDCSPNTVQWTFDLYSNAYNAAKEASATAGKNWYFITLDYAGGHGLEAVAKKFVEQTGGKVLGHTLPPLNNVDYSSFLLQAQGSRADVIGLAMGGGDLMNTIKQAGEFGIVDGGQKLVALAIFINDVHGLGLDAAKGLIFASAFYWDLNDGTRAFAKRFEQRSGGNKPSDVQAGVYASVLHYLKAVAAADTTSAPTVVAKMKEMPTDDPLFGKGHIRPDGRKIHDMKVVEVKTPKESKYPWDYLKIVKTIPGEEAFEKPSPDKCPLAK